MNQPKGQTVIITDDHPLFRMAIRHSISAIMPDAIIHEADSFETLRKIMASIGNADAAFLDLEIPGANGFSALLHIQKTSPDTKVAIVSGVENPLCQRAAQLLGAHAFVPKSSSPQQMVEAFTALLAGDLWYPLATDALDADDIANATKLNSLTRQELRILISLSEGRMNKQIAYEIGIREGTVKVHMKSILRKLGTQHRTQAALIAQRILKTEPTSRDALKTAVENPEP